MAAALAGCRMKLAEPFLTLSAQMCIETTPLPLNCRGTISGTVGSFQSGGVFASWRALTIESSQMSGQGYSHEPTENVLWLKFPVL